MDDEIKESIKSYYDFYFGLSSVYENWAKQHDLTVNSLFVLYTIQEYTNECTQSLICEKQFLPKQTVNTILDNLEKKGMIIKKISEEDKRTKFILFTQKGRIYAESLLMELYQFEEKAFKQMHHFQREAMIQNSHVFLKQLKDGLKSE